MQLPAFAKQAVFGSIGVLLLIAAVVLAVAIHGSATHAKSADGIVTKLNAGHAHVEVEFTTEAGQTISYPQNGAIRLDVGEHVRVLYDESDPDGTASIDTIGALYFAPGMLALLGLGFVVTSLVSFLLARRRVSSR